MVSKFKRFWNKEVRKIGGNVQQEADRLMSIDVSIWNKYGYRSGDAVAKDWNRYVAEVGSRITGGISREVYDILEDNNFHSLLEALTQLGKVRR